MSQLYKDSQCVVLLLTPSVTHMYIV